MNLRQLFLQHVAQTSPQPLALEIVKAKGSKLWDKDGKEYIDLIAGISVANIGHAHPEVVKAIKTQAEKYLHVLVYGEMVESPEVLYAKLLTDNLPESLNSVYFTNSGAEAVEGAMKLAKRYTGRTEIAAFNKSYHGSTQGALSILGDEYWRNAYRPLLPAILHLDYNSEKSIDLITEQTAAVFVEMVQAERGVFPANKEWILALRKKCNETGTLLIVDAIQTGFGRTGQLWGFENSGITPDILLLGKALGGGMPLGAFISNKEIMQVLTSNPVLGHITTFGGHPVCCAAGMAAMKLLLQKNLTESVMKKKEVFIKKLKHPAIKEIRAEGLLMAVEFESFEICKKVIDKAIENGVLTDWFLFGSNCLRIAPPLNISINEINKSCSVILNAIDQSG